MASSHATSHYIRTSAQKAGLVLDQIRGKDIGHALAGGGPVVRVEMMDLAGGHWVEPRERNHAGTQPRGPQRPLQFRIRRTQQYVASAFRRKHLIRIRRGK